MKILFLDIDGVCNHVGTRQRHSGFIGVNPIMAGIVRIIVSATDCKVVLSSVWRLSEDGRKHVEKKVTPFIDVTPHIPGELRGREIQQWLDHHPEVTRYAILDDDSDFLDGQHLFKTTWQEGLTHSIAKEVIAHLNSV